MFSFSVLKTVGLLLSMFSASYSTFVIGRFLIGFAATGTFLPSFVLGVFPVALLGLPGGVTFVECISALCLLDWYQPHLLLHCPVIPRLDDEASS